MADSARRDADVSRNIAQAPARILASGYGRSTDRGWLIRNGLFEQPGVLPMRIGAPRHAGLGTILIVDDDPRLRSLAVDILTDAGFATCQAGNAEAAIDHLNAASNAALLLTDAKLPGSMDGLQLVSLVHKFRPQIKFIVVSGDVGQCVVGLPRGSRFVSKPYNAVSLIFDVHSILQPKAPAPSSSLPPNEPFSSDKRPSMS